MPRFSRVPFYASKGQSGINMVDLMMWLVIAALLLAAAIQGIGYYQQRAYIEQMSNDVKHAGEVTMTLASSSSGVITEPLIRQAISETSSTGDVSLMSKNLGAGYFAIEASHPAITKNRVVFAFGTREKLNPGVNITKVDTVDTQQLASLASECPDGSWKAQYFGNLDWSGSTILERCEAKVDYNWGYGAPPAPGINPDRFSSMWTKNFTVSEATEYKFSIIGDDYVAVWLDGKQILLADYWYGTSKPTQTVYLKVSAGTHNLVVKHNERGGGASIKFIDEPSAP